MSAGGAAAAPAFPGSPPRPGAGRVLRQLLPSVPGCGLAALAALLLVLGAFVATVFGLTSIDTRTGQSNPGLYLLLLATFVVPVASALSALAALLSRRLGARGLLLLSTAAVLLLGNWSCARGLRSLDVSAGSAWAWASASYGGTALVMAIAGAGALSLLPLRVRESLAGDRARWVRGEIEARGAVDMAELASALGIEVSGLRDILVELVASGMALRVEEGAGRVYTAARGRELHERMGIAVAERGRVALDDLAAELGEPRAIVEGWIGELVLGGRLVATIDRERGIVVFDPRGGGRSGSAEVRHLDCDGCGGVMRAVGGGLHRCVYCGSEAEVAA